MAVGLKFSFGAWKTAAHLVFIFGMRSDNSREALHIDDRRKEKIRTEDRKSATDLEMSVFYVMPTQAGIQRDRFQPLTRLESGRTDGGQCPPYSSCEKKCYTDKLAISYFRAYGGLPHHETFNTPSMVSQPDGCG